MAVVVVPHSFCPLGHPGLKQESSTQAQRPVVGITVVRQWWQVSEVIERPVPSWACRCVTHTAAVVSWNLD